MASIVLGTIGTAIGGAVGGPLGASLGSGLGRVLGASVDASLFGGGSLSPVEGARLSDLIVQTSTYGRMIPIVYGTARIAGNIIWSRPIKETATTTTHSSGGGKGGGGGGVSQTATSYSYSVTLAIAICEGPIDSVQRVWADALQLDLSKGNYRIHKGTEDQLPDSIITAFEGAGKVPAYRGMAYVVIEDFPLGEFGNRIPNFTFEIKKKAQQTDSYGDLEGMIKAVNLIPGSGEFVYDTVVQTKQYGVRVEGEWAQRGSRMPMNMHNPDGVANVVKAIDQLEEALPNVEWVSIVAGWFGTSMDAGTCQIVPGVEYQTGAVTVPDQWAVAGRNRTNARQITLIDGVPRYGGTPSDSSIVRLAEHLRARGKKVMFNPMFWMDVADKPWRGRLTGSAANVASFFTKTNGYNAFIMHYANLLAGKVDAFSIGSELIGLTKVASSEGVYPAVNALASLAVEVKAVLGSGTKVTYAADWSEYHHTEGGWYNLDPLWASSGIDVVGIDAYFPLTDGIQQGYDVEAAREGWTSGEGYDWYYTDDTRTVKAPLGAAYAWKNIAWWWNNAHVNPNGVTTAWVPASKKIWLAEYGFPSVDGATNQPNVFYDPESLEGGFPRFSRGRVDFRAQRMGMMATEQQWAGSSMVERMFVWAWDARPFPYWPDLTNVWADGGAWRMGHWIQGKLGISGLASIVGDLCERAGLDATQVDASRLSHLVEGCVISNPQSVRQALQQLMTGFLFDAVESDGQLKFVPRGGASAKTITAKELVPVSEGDALTVRMQQEVELPREVRVLYIDRTANYTQGNHFATRQVTLSRQSKTISLPIVFSDQGAKVLAEQMLYNHWMERTGFEFHLPMAYAGLEPTDVITLEDGDAVHRMRISEVVQSTPGILRIRAVAEDAATYDVYQPSGEADPRIQQPIAVSETAMEFLDLPLLMQDGGQNSSLHIALAGLDTGWKGAAVFRSDDGGEEYGMVARATSASIMGRTLNALASGKTEVLDEASYVDVLLIGEGELSGVSMESLLNGANTCLIGQEVLQFRQAEHIEGGAYRLSGLLRGRAGTERVVDGHGAGEKFFLLSATVQRLEMPSSMIGLPRLYKGVSIGGSLGSTEAQLFTYSGNALRPYAVCHVTATRNGSGDVILRWVRRTRTGGEWRDFVDAPLGENTERYEVEVMNGSVVKRLLTVTTPEATYTAAEQVTDFGSVQPSLSIRIYQLSDVIGRGFTKAAIV
ncbi:MAG: hypothetical protein FJX23_04215 [Alphaproteobacteria bacterium]|nr:hypothetical protein [Alphaproteobacteria bacterium]